MPIAEFNQVLSEDSLNVGRIRWNSNLNTIRIAHNALEASVIDNTADISLNAATISQHSTDIQSNSDDIDSNTALISNNSADISTNSISITALQNRNINTTRSITGGGNLSADRTLQLVNDVDTPGPVKVYGTNSSGVRGWQDLSNSLIASSINAVINQVGHGFSIGDVLQHDGSNYTLASSDTEFDSEVIGIVSGVVDANNFTLTYGGFILGLSGLTAGNTYFLNSTGGLSATPGVVSKPIFIATDTTEGIFFNFRGAVEDDMIAGEFNYNNTGIVIANGADSELSFPITYNRLLGVSVALTGLTAGQTATVNFYGDAARTELQHSVDFTDTITVEDTESWRYRSVALDDTAYVTIVNTSGSQITVDLDVVAEPF